MTVFNWAARCVMAYCLRSDTKIDSRITNARVAKSALTLLASALLVLGPPVTAVNYGCSACQCSCGSILFDDALMAV